MSAQPRHAPAVVLGAVLVQVLCVLVRCTSLHDMFPHWEGAPLDLPAPSVGVRPAESLLIDVVQIAGAFAALWGCAVLGLGVSMGRVALALIPLGALAWHARGASGQQLDNLLIGSSWLAAACSGLSMWHAGRLEHVRRLGAALLLSIAGILLVRGLVQVLIEQRETLAMFERNKEAFFQSRGWTPDSPMARSFVRRISQFEATGWFGLANVYASVQAACCVGLLGLAAGAWKQRRSGTAAWAIACVAAGAGCGAGGVLLANAKGGMGAVVLGLVVLVVGGVTLAKPGMARWVRRPAGWIGFGAVAAVLLGVVARGLVGEQLGEHSLLFRWFYLQGAVGAVASSPIVGVGPYGFKDAFLVTKPALSPEDVASPHSVLFDWLSMLGVFGAAWCGLWVWWLRDAGKRLVEEPAREQPRDEPLAWPRECTILLAVLALGTGLSSWLERVAGTPMTAGVRLLGLGAALAISCGVAACLRGGRSPAAFRLSMAAGAIAVAAHSQIEVTGTTFGAASWSMMLLGLAAAPAGIAAESGGGRPRLIVILGGAAALALPAAFSGRVGEWQGALTTAYGWADTSNHFRVRKDEVGRKLPSALVPDDTPAKFAVDLSAAMAQRGLLPPASAGLKDVEASLDLLRQSSAERCLERLKRAGRLFPSHAPTLEATTKLLLVRGDFARRNGDVELTRAACDEALALARETAQRFGPRSQLSAWVAILEQTAEGWLPGEGHAQRAIEALLEAAATAPNEVSHAVRLSDLYSSTGDDASAARWAQQALDLDALRRLDPLVQMGDARRTRLQSRVSAAPGGS